MSEHRMNVHRLYQNPLPEPGLDTFAPLPRQPSGRMEPPRRDRNRLVCAVLARRWTIVATVVLAMLAAGAVVLRTPVIYSASAVVLVGDGPAGDHMRLMQSTSMAERVITKLNLTHDREFAREAGGSWNPLSWFDTPAPKIEAGARKAGVDPALLKGFASRLAVSAEGRPGMVRVTFESANRNKAALVANTVAGEFVAARAASQAPGAVVDEHLNQLTEAVTQAEGALAQYKSQGGSPVAVNSGLATDQIAEVNGQLETARADLAAHQEQLRQASATARAASPVAALRKRHEDLVRKETELSVKYGDRHPQMIALREEKAGLQAKIDEATKSATAALAAKVATAKARVSSLEASLRDLQGTIPASAPAVTLDPAVLRNLESDLQARRTALQLYQANPDQPQIRAGVSGAQVVKKAVAPDESSSAAGAPVLMGATLFGSALLGLLLALIIDRPGNTFRTASEIERIARSVNLAVVPRASGKHVADLIVQKPHSPFAEALRSLYSGLQLSDIDRAPRVVLMTSSNPREGKTTLAISLARLVAKSGARVLLIDGDLRSPSVAGRFSPRPPQVGLVELLLGQCNFKDIVHRDPISPLEFVPVAAPVANPADLLGSLGFQKMIEVLRQHYDLVVIDAAPVLPVPDARLLARISDKVIYTIGWETTQRDAVTTGLKLLRDVHADVAGTVLNHADMRRHAIYGYGTAYGYGSKNARYDTE